MKQMHKQGLLNRQVLRLWYLIWEVENPHLRSWPTSSKCILVGLIFFFRYLNNWLPSQRVWTMHPPRVLTLSSIRAFDKFLQQITYLDLSPKYSWKVFFRLSWAQNTIFKSWPRDYLLSLVSCQKLNLADMYIIKQSNSELKVNFMNTTIAKWSLRYR